MSYSILSSNPIAAHLLICREKEKRGISVDFDGHTEDALSFFAAATDLVTQILVEEGMPLEEVVHSISQNAGSLALQSLKRLKDKNEEDEEE